MVQGWDNFRKEAKQLRRSFRFNEYKEIRAQNPPRNFFTKVMSHSVPSDCPLKGADAPLLESSCSSRGAWGPSAWRM